MKAQLSPKDWQQLSEYLDDQLSPKEKQRLEERIRLHSDLRNGLEELRHTRLILRSVPKRPAPRNFTLTPEMVRPRSVSRLFPVLSFSSALATILIIATLLLKLMPSTSPAVASESQRFAAPAAAPMTMSAAQSTGAGVQASPSPQIITWGQQPSGNIRQQTNPAAGAAVPLMAPGVVETQPAQEASPAAPLQAPLVSAAPTTAGTPQPDLSLPTTQVLTAPTQPVSTSSTAITMNKSGPILGIPPQSDQGKILSAPTAEAVAPQPVESQPAQPAQPTFPSWILLEAVLAVIAIGSGLAAYFLWRRVKQ